MKELVGLTSISPLDGRYREKIGVLRAIFGEFGLIRARVKVEVRWFQHLAGVEEVVELPPLTQEEEEVLEALLEDFDEREAHHVKVLERTTNHDVKAVEYYLKERFSQHAGLDARKEFLHFACTSEDINNLAYSSMTRMGLQEVLLPALWALEGSLVEMAHHYADAAMLSRTHGQAASPTTMGKEIANVVMRLRRQREGLEQLEFPGKCNGAVGNYNAHICAYPEVDWEVQTRLFVERLGLSWNRYTTQIEPHDELATLLQALMRVNTILLDLCRDVWGYVSLGYFRQRAVEGEVGSSTMPHKVNPIDFENAEGNLGLANALFGHLAQKLPISRWQRDLSDSTVLRNVGVGFGHSLLAILSIQKGLSKLSLDHTRLTQELDENWEVLAEPIQMLMRRYQIEAPYETLKALTRGKQISQQELVAFVRQLGLPDDATKRLEALTPATYTGLAAKLARAV